MSGLIFSTTFVCNKVPLLFLCLTEMNECSRQLFQKMFKYQILWKSIQWESICFVQMDRYTDRRKDGLTDVRDKAIQHEPTKCALSKLILQFFFSFLNLYYKSDYYFIKCPFRFFSCINYTVLSKSRCALIKTSFSIERTIVSKILIKQLRTLPGLHFKRCLTTEYGEITAHFNGNFDTDNQIYVS
jgi:hypothetical protein